MSSGSPCKTRLFADNENALRYSRWFKFESFLARNSFEQIVKKRNLVIIIKCCLLYLSASAHCGWTTVTHYDCVCVCVVVWKSSFKAMGSAGAEALIYLCVSQHISGTRGPDTTDRQKWIHQIRAVMIIMCFKGGGGYNLALRPSLPRFYQVVRVPTILQCISQWITPVCSW